MAHNRFTAAALATAFAASSLSSILTSALFAQDLSWWWALPVASIACWVVLVRAAPPSLWRVAWRQAVPQLVLALVLLGGVLAILFFASFVLTFAAGLCGGGGGWRVAAWALGAVVYLLLGTRAFLRPRSELWWALPFAAIVGAVAMNLLAVAVPATHGICD